MENKVKEAIAIVETKHDTRMCQAPFHLWVNNTPKDLFLWIWLFNPSTLLCTSRALTQGIRFYRPRVQKKQEA